MRQLRPESKPGPAYRADPYTGFQPHAQGSAGRREAFGAANG